MRLKCSPVLTFLPVLFVLRFAAQTAASLLSKQTSKGVSEVKFCLSRLFCGRKSVSRPLFRSQFTTHWIYFPQVHSHN